VLFHTGWDQHWRTETYWNGEHPFLHRRRRNLSREGGAKIVGIDSYNIDSIADGKRPTHSSCWAMTFRSSSTCADSANCPIQASDSLQCR
jgi:kynurenine formamidase